MNHESQCLGCHKLVCCNVLPSSRLLNVTHQELMLILQTIHEVHTAFGTLAAFARRSTGEQCASRALVADDVSIADDAVFLSNRADVAILEPR